MATDDRITRPLKILAIIALSVALVAVTLMLLHRIMTVVIVVGGAVFFAYLIYPLVSWFSRRLPRWLAILCVYVAVVIVVGAFATFLGPKLGMQARGLANDLPRVAQQTQNWVLSANSAIVAAIPLESRESAVRLLDEAGASVVKEAMQIAGQAVTILLSLASMITAFVIIPVLAFYILMDADRLRAGTMRLVPLNYRPTALAVLGDIDGILGGFIRGQIIVGASIAVLVTALLVILHIKYALLIGVFAGIVDIIPYLGAVAGAIPAVIIALFTHGLGWALLVIGGFILIYQAEGHIIAPNVVGQRVGLTPLAVIVAILIGAELGGILGMFVSVPIAGIIKALLNRFAPPAADETVVKVHERKEREGAGVAAGSSDGNKATGTQ